MSGQAETPTIRPQSQDAPLQTSDTSTVIFDRQAYINLCCSIFEEVEQETIVQHFLREVSSIVPVTFSAISLKPNAYRFYWWAAGQRNGQSLPARLLDRIAGLSEHTLADSLLRNDVASHQHYRHDYIDPQQLRITAPDIGSMLVMPIQSIRNQFGLLFVAKGAEATYTAVEQDCLHMLAIQLASALEVAFHYTQTCDRDREFDLIYQTGQQMTQLLDLTELTSQLVKAVSETFEYESVTLLLTDETTGELVVEDTHGLSKEKHVGFRIPITDELMGGIVGWVAARGKPYMAEDVHKEQRYIETVKETRSEVAVPLMIKGRVIGVLDVQSTKVKGFTENDRYILETLADQVAVAIENARLYEELASAHAEIQQTSKQLQRLLERTVKIQEQERRRIAADIHDNINQLLYGAVYEAQAALQSLPNSESPIRDNLRNIQATLDRTHSEIRKAIFNLWPTSLDEMGLLPSLQSLLSKFKKDSGISGSLEIMGPSIDFDSLARINIYRIVQEALYNVQKHAHASNVDIRFHFTSDTVTVSISDNGVGFKWETLVDEPDRHLGLISMRERARSIGGQLQIDSEPGEGTVLTLEFPRSAVEQADESQATIGGC